MMEYILFIYLAKPIFIYLSEIKAEAISKSTCAKVHGSVSVDALQRKEAEESACSKLHDPAFKITEIYFREKLLCNFLAVNGNY